MNPSEDEFIPEDGASSSFEEENQEDGPAALKKLREKLKKAVDEKQEYLESWQRVRADFANFKREEALMHIDKEERLKAEFIETMLPALDTLELSLKHHDDSTLKMIERQFLNSLSGFGIERYGKEGDAFDPKYYEAIDQKGTPDETKDDTVLEVRRSGYKTGEKVIRPAQIVLATHQQIDKL